MKITNLFFILVFCISCSTSIQENEQKAQLLDSSNCNEGSSREGYTTPIVNGIERCIKSVQFCENGNWEGPELYDFCDNPTEDCDGLPHGTFESGYLTPFAPCEESSRICIDGVWQGPTLHSHCH
jgi:hypothetical protein